MGSTSTPRNASRPGLDGLREGIVHHLDLWREAVRADRARPKPGPAGRAELAFLPAALEVAETPVSPAARAVAFTIAAFFVLAVAWASVGRLDIVATAAGKIIPSERVKQVQPLETSIVHAVHVTEGQAVGTGDILVELEVVGGAADVARLRTELATARLDSARLAALLEPDPRAAFVPPADAPAAVAEVQTMLLESQLKEHHAKLAVLVADLAKRQAELRTVDTDLRRLEQVAVKIRDETERRQELARKGFGSQIERARSEKELADNAGQQQVQKARQAEIRAGIDSLHSQIDQAREEFRRDVAARLAEARTKAAVVEQELAKAADRQRVHVLRSPVNGIVQQIAVHTVGGVVTPAQRLMVVVPSDVALEVEAKLSNKDIGFVEPGQEAEIKIDAFPFTRYGTIRARVEMVSLDAVEDTESQPRQVYFPVRLSLADTAITVENGRRIPLTSGMTTAVEVKTGTRKPIEYVLAPLQKYRDEGGRER